MTNEVFNIFASVGIGLTFLASLTAIIVSVISLKSSKAIARQSGYLNTITVARERWQSIMREKSSMYYTQISRICSGHEDNLHNIHNELIMYHYSITLLLFEKDKPIIEHMDVIKEQSLEIIKLYDQIKQRCEELGNQPGIDTEKDCSVLQARQEIAVRKNKILTIDFTHVSNEISRLLEAEWRKQQDEATRMWDQTTSGLKPD